MKPDQKQFGQLGWWFFFFFFHCAQPPCHIRHIEAAVFWPEPLCCDKCANRAAEGLPYRFLSPSWHKLHIKTESCDVCVCVCGEQQYESNFSGNVCWKGQSCFSRLPSTSLSVFAALIICWQMKYSKLGNNEIMSDFVLIHFQLLSLGMHWYRSRYRVLVPLPGLSTLFVLVTCVPIAQHQYRLYKYVYGI